MSSLRVANHLGRMIVVESLIVKAVCETISGEGTRYPGHPIFMKDKNVQSFMTGMATYFQKTQQTISALCKAS